MVYTVHGETRLFSGDRIAPPEASKAGEVHVQDEIEQTWRRQSRCAQRGDDAAAGYADEALVADAEIVERGEDADMHGEPGTAAREYRYEIEAGYRAGRVQACTKGDTWPLVSAFPAT